MRQAIEEAFILDVLKNYTSYKVAYNLAQKVASADVEVDSKKAKIKLGHWVRLHDHNIGQKVKAIVEHFRDKVARLLGGQAKAIVVTGSREGAVRYKLGFDKYIHQQGYSDLNAVVAFSGEVEFSDPGKIETYVLDFFNDPAEVLKAFQAYYQTLAFSTSATPISSGICSISSEPRASFCGLR